MKIRELHVEKFKRFSSLDLELGDFDLLIGPNQCGKSTVLQALTVFQFCLSATLSSRRATDGTTETVLKHKGFGWEEFTPIPIAHPLDLWTDRFQQRFKRQIRFKIEVIFDTGGKVSMSIGLPHNRFSIHPNAENVANLDILRGVSIVFVPSFAGLLVKEQYQTPAMKRALRASGRHGEIIRNTLLELKKYPEKHGQLQRILANAFGTDLKEIDFDAETDVYIGSQYDEGRPKLFEIASSGSGLHQFVQILAFIMIEKPTTVLMDEPDAHIHSALQAELLRVIQQIAEAEDVQVVIATHSKELIEAVGPHNIISFSPEGVPTHLRTRYDVLEAIRNLGALDNIDLANLRHCQKCIFVEGRFDRKAIEMLVEKVGNESLARRLRVGTVFIKMGGRDKPVTDMLAMLQQLFDTPNRIDALVVRDRDYMLQDDYESYEDLFNTEGQTWHIWRKNEIENFLLIPEAIHRLLVRKYPDSPLLIPSTEQIQQWLDEECEHLVDEVFDSLCSEFSRLDRKSDPKTVNQRAREYLESRWNARSKLSLCKGTQIMQRLQQRLRERDMTFSLEELLAEIRIDELDNDIQVLLEKLAHFLDIEPRSENSHG